MLGNKKEAFSKNLKALGFGSLYTAKWSIEGIAIHFQNIHKGMSYL